jgi:hypothetical protein
MSKGGHPVGRSQPQLSPSPFWRLAGSGPLRASGLRLRPPSAPSFRDVAVTAGLDFLHVNGASEEKFFPEIMGSGGLFLDFDNDGWLDVFLVDGGSFADPAVARRARHRLYRNRRNGTFEDVTARANIPHRDYGMGACAGDFDNDGLTDLYITNVGPNALYRNTGGGRFAEVPKAGGADWALWSTSCAFVDIDRDGDLDLFVTNYVDATKAKKDAARTDIVRANQFCGIAGPPAIRDYCHPLTYDPLASVLYRNTGRGRSRTSRSQAESHRISATASASPSRISTTTACPTCSSPTTAHPTSCSTTRATAPSRRSAASPASRLQPTARHGPAWERRSPTSTAAASPDWS